MNGRQKPDEYVAAFAVESEHPSLFRNLQKRDECECDGRSQTHSHDFGVWMRITKNEGPAQYQIPSRRFKIRSPRCVTDSPPRGRR